MSAQATTLLFAISMLRKQQLGVVLFRDYAPVVSRMAGEIIGKGC